MDWGESVLIAKVSRSELARIVAAQVEGVTDHDRDEMAIPSYLHSNPLIRWLMWRRYEVIAEFAAAEAAQSVVEFGCGTGMFLPELSRRYPRVVAIDLFPQFAQRLVEKQKLSVTFVDNLEELADESVDLIIAADVLEHITELTPYLMLFNQKLRPGGRLLISGPTESWVYKFGRLVAGFGGKGDYHHTNIDRLIAQIEAFGMARTQLRALPFAGLPALFKVGEFTRVAEE